MIPREILKKIQQIEIRTNCRIRLALTVMLGGASISFNSLRAEESAGGTHSSSDGFSLVLQSLEKNGGVLKPAVRAAYLEWAEQSVSNQLAAADCIVPEDCWKEVHSDSNLRDAMFGAVFPPDPDILQNYCQLRSALSASFLKRYRSLVIATAVARRNQDLTPDEHSSPKKKKKGKQADYFRDLEADLQPDEADDNQQLARAIADFMKAERISALELYQTPAAQQRLFQFLKDQSVEPALIARTEKHLGPALMGAMIVLGQRPASREAEPDVVTWLRYLASVYEAKPKSTPTVGKKNEPMPWPLFPMDKCPWPLLMSLGQPMPLGEARYIWETFQGEHGPKRYHDYGPYRSRANELLYELQPSPLHWNSWQDRIVHGGVCVVMATIALDTHHALCEPAVHAGQPHHANLIAYHKVGGEWVALIEQSFAGGPPVTHAAWLFQDGDAAPRLMASNRCGSEYQLGLAAGMNVGLSRYIDTRIAVNLFNTLPEEKKKTIGVTLLNQAIQANPFNPAPWYLLAEQNPGAAQKLLAADPAAAESIKTDKIAKKRASHDMPAILDRDNPRIAQIQIERYWQTVGEFLPNPANSAVRKPAARAKASSRN